MNLLTSRMVRAPLMCRLVSDYPASLAGVMALLEMERDVQVTVHTRVVELDQVPVRDCLIILALETDDVATATLAIHRLVLRRARVAVVADGFSGDQCGPLWLAGACCVMTDRSQWDKVVAVVRSCREYCPLQPVDWREDFLRRLPWGRAQQRPAACSVFVSDPAAGR
jgi:hypothetical protein